MTVYWEESKQVTVEELEKKDVFRTVTVTDKDDFMLTECMEEDDRDRLLYSSTKNFKTSDTHFVQVTFESIKQDMALDYFSLNARERVLIQKFYSQCIQMNRIFLFTKKLKDLAALQCPS